LEALIMCNHRAHSYLKNERKKNEIAATLDKRGLIGC
jgi:hypothetical protein